MNNSNAIVFVVMFVSLCAAVEFARFILKGNRK